MKKNLITVLKKLVLSFGGKAESNNAVDLVDEFADVAAQGGGGSGGVQPVIVQLPFDAQSETMTWSGATWEELLDAFDSGVAFVNMTSASEPDNLTKMLLSVYAVFEGTERLIAVMSSGDGIGLRPDGTVETLSG